MAAVSTVWVVAWGVQSIIHQRVQGEAMPWRRLTGDRKFLECRYLPLDKNFRRVYAEGMNRSGHVGMSWRYWRCYVFAAAYALVFSVTGYIVFRLGLSDGWATLVSFVCAFPVLILTGGVYRGSGYGNGAEAGASARGEEVPRTRAAVVVG
jgi:hypothetical protein